MHRNFCSTQTRQCHRDNRSFAQTVLKVASHGENRNKLADCHLGQSIRLDYSSHICMDARPNRDESIPREPRGHPHFGWRPPTLPPPSQLCSEQLAENTYYTNAINAAIITVAHRQTLFDNLNHQTHRRQKRPAALILRAQPANSASGKNRRCPKFSGENFGHLQTSLGKNQRCPQPRGELWAPSTSGQLWQIHEEEYRCLKTR